MDSVQTEKSSWVARQRQTKDGTQAVEQVPVVSVGPNESTRKNLKALQMFLDENFPVDLQYTMPFVVHDENGHRRKDYDNPADREARQKLVDQRREQNIALHAAFARYKASASLANPLFEYVEKHKAEGFSPEEITLLISYLSFRTNPTLGDLFFKDGLLHNNDLHTVWLRGNIGDEAGGGVLDKNAPVLDPHIDLQYNSFATWKRAHPNQLLYVPDDICTYAIMKQLILFRKEGIRFDQKLNKETMLRDKPRWQDTVKECEAFNDLCHERRLLLPHRVREAWLRTREQGHERMLSSGKATIDGNKEILAGTRVEGTELNHPYGTFRMGYENAAEEFDTAVRLVAGMSDKAIDYAAKTLEQQSIGPQTSDVIASLDKHLAPLTQRDDAQAETLRQLLGNAKEALKKQDSALRPYDAATMLKHELALLTREASADLRSHIDAYRQLVATYAGYIDVKKLGKAEYAKEIKRARLYADIHVSEETGVEGSHADLARDLFMTLAHAVTGHNKLDLGVAPMLTDAFNYVVDESYLKLQHGHMEEAVKQLEEARARAVAYSSDAKGQLWKDPFIKPKAEQPPRTLTENLNPANHVRDWVKKTGESMLGGIAAGY